MASAERAEEVCESAPGATERMRSIRVSGLAS